MKTILVIILAANSILKVMGQTDSLAVNVSLGNVVRVNLAVGEIMTEKQGKANALLLQDFQGMADHVAFIPDESFVAIGVRVFPTQTPDFVNVVISESVKDDLTGEFIDKSGKPVKHVVLDALHNEINIKDLNQGEYQLRISSMNKRVSEVTISKVKTSNP